jgi:hypothetical protein
MWHILLLQARLQEPRRVMTWRRGARFADSAVLTQHRVAQQC